MKILKLLFVTLIACVSISGYAVAASDIDFEDLGTQILDAGQLPSGYAGFTWNTNSWYLKQGTYPRNPRYGYDDGIVSDGGVNVGLVTSGLYPDSTIQMSSTTTFDFFGAYITSAWRTNQDVLVEGFLGSSTAYSETINTSSDGPYWNSFNFTGIDKLVFTPIDNGTPVDSGYLVDYRIVVDNITLTPEPIGSVLFLLGGGALAVARRKKKRA